MNSISLNQWAKPPRYPAISQLIAENRIPEFDALYLDMNGIIHNCTHKDSDSPTFRMTEEKMFIAIFNYIEHLFGKIKPKKLFFMAIDGVAPRAKMNQQRARRFRTALDNEKAYQKALKDGVEMPKEDPFDSNCITPGTVFMAKLSRQLQYFVNKKVSEDVDWQGVEIILSGHEVPGEGEHKIMEYIRLAKAQPGYDPNLRHCLYGLDADLIMLGLLSHDPHFCLLREEVTFGRNNQKKSKELEHQNFYLMHLSIVREYLELEFQELKQPGLLSVPYDFERVLDDFILLAFFVGNDFLPHLPGLHINEGALSLMFKIYKKVLPKAKGYINDHGQVNVESLGLVLDEMEEFEYKVFEMEAADASWLKGKQMKELEAAAKPKKSGKLVMTTLQQELYRQVRQFVEGRKKEGSEKLFNLPKDLKAGDRKFVEELAQSLRLQYVTVTEENGDKFLRLSFYPSLDDDDEFEEEGDAALQRVFKAFEKASIVDISVDEAKAEMERLYQERFHGWRDHYYKDKFGWGLEDEADIRGLTENYIQGIQWVLFYYYRGVASWGWFFHYHYAPKISDVKKGLRADLNFRLGSPFRPFEQLMGVLPDRSKKIVPEPYHVLMTSPDSPIIDFYPRDFDLDMNGKKQDWEAVVKIPFIEENRLLTAMRTREHMLTEDERKRNGFGITLKFTYSETVDTPYPSSMEGVFPDLAHCHCITNEFELPTLDGGLNLIQGLCDGVRLGANALAGFPTLKSLDHTGQLLYHSVNVFQQDSKNESMVITLIHPAKGSTVEGIAATKINQRVYVGYPFLGEAQVAAVSDELFKYTLDAHGQVQKVPHADKDRDYWRTKADRIEHNYSKRMGMIIGGVDVILHVNHLKGLRRTDEGAMVKEFENLPGQDTDYAFQIAVDPEKVSEDERFIEKAAVDIATEFPAGSRCFFLGDYNYGRPLEVTGHRGDKADIFISILKGKEPDFGTRVAYLIDQANRYVPSYAVARSLGLTSLVLSKITSSFQVQVDDTRQNLGLNLKFEAKKLKVLGYSRKANSGWEFSQTAIDLIRDYMVKFPDFFRGIERKPTADIYTAEDFYPVDVAKAKIKEIQTWLKEIEAKSFERVPLEAEQLDSEAVGIIEREADKYVQSLGSGADAKPIRGVPRRALLKPSDAEHRLHDQKYALGDRIVYVQDSGKVPIATKGTVVGITKTARTTLLDVVFDVSFMSGSTLGDRCSPFRGMTVPFSSVLNLTNRQVVANSKASTKVGAPEGTQNVKGGQFIPATAPPPLRGSFSGAIGGRGNTNGGAPNGRGNHVPQGPGGSRGTHGQGQQNTRGQNTHRGGGRGAAPGRGNFNNQQVNGAAPAQPQTFNNRGNSQNGHQPVILQRRPHNGPGGQSPRAQNQQQQTQGHHAVPPPANLNQPRGNRGRGRGGRGRAMPAQATPAQPAQPSASQ
ncbi:hypothetical protein H072_7258 [Dactylellina haptotyla CBS 200.50]|uniref:5'-3' exoribonuclease 1 n=1 Tax=Dactylellina haptotyla (strain CBS 200.50) TaxID=1284197 RepID=S8A7I2_DACHA|nr:hypothetical protein H072_7258 [Dactylellina haptotyla CBS 200.50]